MSSEGSSSTLFERCPKHLDRKRIREFHARLVREVTAGRTFDCLVTSDAKLQELNARFLAQDYPTDVLSFPEPGANGHLGELAISAQRAQAQAAEFGHGLEDEIAILMLHGALHLTGMDHEGDRGAMRRSESAWRKKLDLPAGLIERSGRKR